MSKYLPFEITEFNDMIDDRKAVFQPDTGTIWVRIGKLDLEITQSADGKRVIIEALDAELCEQSLGSLEVAFDNILELPLNENGTHPLKQNV